MSEGRLPTEIWLTAGLRRCSNDGIPATVVRRGEKQSGTVALKLNQREAGCRVLTQGRDADGKLTWFAALDGALVDEAEADAYLERTASRDPDIWIIEIEHRDGWHPFEDGLF
ncbi:MAG: DUF1491 family protein [Alphaproteobacteria bacterium]|nr:DUF1491 family protein [Alphaproteobacteria bacterium]